LYLAWGYLFSAIVVVSQTLTFPGAFSATGLLGAGPQTAAWIYIPWHLGIPLAAIGYALSKARQGEAREFHGSTSAVIACAAFVSVSAALVVVWAAVEFGDRLPVLVVSETQFSAMASVVTALPFAASIVAILVLWRKRSSVLDEWLMVALSASVAETAVIVFIAASRYSLVFYTTRVFAMVVSSAVLVALLTDMTRMYVRLSSVVKALQRERATKLMNLDVVVSSIGHEIRQPLTVTRMCTETIETLLKKPKIEVDEVRENVEDITSSTLRIAETIDSLRGLFRNPHEDAQRVDVNEIVFDSLRILAAELDERGIEVTRSFTSLPRVVGHPGQLREVFVNIVQNSIDAMTPRSNRPRRLNVATSLQNGMVSVKVRDSGPGIEPARLPNIFTAFISTKAFGMGLGLSICQMIVDRHDGQLSVSSELGEGTEFEVRLPAETAPRPEQPSLAPGSIKAEA
jgi:signal transduction histidine kinase